MSTELTKQTREHNVQSFQSLLTADVTLNHLKKNPDQLVECKLDCVSAIMDVLQSYENFSHGDPSDKIKLGKSNSNFRLSLFLTPAIRTDLLPLALSQHAQDESLTHLYEIHSERSIVERCSRFLCDELCLGPNSQNETGAHDKFARTSSQLPGSLPFWPRTSLTARAVTVGPLYFLPMENGKIVPRENVTAATVTAPVWTLDIDLNTVNRSANSHMPTRALPEPEPVLKKRRAPKKSVANNRDYAMNAVASDPYRNSVLQIKAAAMKGKETDAETILKWGFAIFHMFTSIRGDSTLSLYLPLKFSWLTVYF